MHLLYLPQFLARLPAPSRARQGDARGGPALDPQHPHPHRIDAHHPPGHPRAASLAATRNRLDETDPIRESFVTKDGGGLASIYGEL